MVISCSAYGCTNRQGQKDGISFYRFPTNSERRAKWVAALRRADWMPSSTSRICSVHFVSGKKSDNPLSPDYVPSLFCFVTSPQKRIKVGQVERFNRRQHIKRRKSEEQRSTAVEALLDLARDKQEPVPQEDDALEPQEEKEDENPTVSEEILKAECQTLRQEVFLLKTKLKYLSLDEDSFKDNDTKVKDLTGLPSYLMLIAIVNNVLGYLREKNILTPFQQVLMTCMKLRCNLNMQFLSYLFGVSRSTISRVFNDVIHVMDRRLVSALVMWPDREQLRMSMPMSFQKTFKHCACIIDCFEIFIERASDLKARAQTYSNYKSHNTMKYLIGITPQGCISYISKGWGGRASDKYITNNCGFLDKLIPGDVILADRGFDVGDSIGLFNAILKIPAFTKGKKQLSPLDVEATRVLASQRIHVERVIGLTRQKYTMLQSIVPITYLLSDQHNLTTLDKIVRVACALTNLSESIVPFD